MPKRRRQFKQAEEPKRLAMRQKSRVIGMGEEPWTEDPNERKMALLIYIFWIVAMAVVQEWIKPTPYFRYHAIQSLALWAICLAITFIIGWSGIWEVLFAMFGFVVAIFFVMIMFIPAFFGYRVYRGARVNIPVLGDRLKNWGWIYKPPEA